MGELSDAERRFDHLRRRVGLWLGPVLFVGALMMPTGLEPRAHRLAAVVVLVMTYWITEPVPLPVTALLGPCLATLMGVAQARDAFAPFAEPVIFLFLGSFLLAEGLRAHGMDRRMALWMLSLPGVGSSVRLRVAIAFVTGFLSMWISNTATAAMMLPVALGLVRALRDAGSDESPRGVILLVGIAASLGGIATPVGTPPNLIALGFLRQRAERSMDFLSFMAVGVPLSLALTGMTLLVVHVLVPPGRGGARLGQEVGKERGILRPWGAGEWACTWAFGLAVTLWVLPGIVAALRLEPASLLGRLSRSLDESLVALLAASLLFFWPVEGRRALTWENAKGIDWGTLLLFGGGLSLGKLMFESGLAGTVGRSVISATGVTSLWGLTALALAFTVLLTELTSNTATVSMLAPLVLAVTGELGLPPVPPLLAVCFGASMGFMFPVGTPPNALVYGTGLVPMTTMMRVGVIVDILSFFVILGGLRILCPLLGMV